MLYGKFGLLIGNLAPTATEAVAGFVIGNAAAIVIATAFVYQRTAEEAFFPIAVMVHTIPVMAYAPILVLLLGNGLSAKVAIAALICFFPTLVNMTRGLRAVSQQQMELMRILSASPERNLLQAAAQMLAALSVRGAQDRRGDLGDRRDRRRVDRRDDRHRRAHHSGDLQFRLAAALRDDRRRLRLLGGVLRRDLLARKPFPQMECRCRPDDRKFDRRSSRSPTHDQSRHDRRAGRRGPDRAARRPCRRRRRAGGHRRGGRRRAQRPLRHASRTLRLSRRPRLRRHGARARRHVQRRRDLGARPLQRDGRAHGAHRALRRAAGIRAPLRRGACGANGRAGASSTFIRTSSPSRSATPPPSIPTASSAHPMRWSAKRKST